MKNLILIRLNNTKSAFILAILVHAIPALIWQLTSHSNSVEWSEGLEQKNLISVDLGGFSMGNKKTGNGGRKQNSSLTSASSTNSSTATTSTTTTNNESTEQNTNSVGNNNSAGIGNGIGNGSGEGLGNGTGFNGAIQNYQEPQYPRAAIKRNLEGTIKVKINVLANGQLKNFDILQSSGHSILDNAAISAIQQWTFKPHPKNIDYFVLKTIIFSLKN